MPGVDDWTLTPHKVLDNIFEECGSTGEWRQKAKDYFERELSQPAVVNKVPWLNETPLHQLRPNQVVRFRGMVQDIYDSEFFMDVYQVEADSGAPLRLLPGRYRDVATCGANEKIRTDGAPCVMGDRLVYYCVPIPGENPWVKEVYEGMNPQPCEPSTSYSSSSRKRSVPEEGEGNSSHQGPDTHCMEVEQGGGEGGSDVDHKRTRGEGVEAAAVSGRQSNGVSGPATPDLNFPLPGMKGTPCILKVYEEKGLRLNDVVEVVGVLSVDPALAPQGSNDQAFMEVEEEAAHCPPPSLVPRLHMLTMRKMEHTNPLLHGEVRPTAGSLREAREALRLVLQEALMGDSLAAELLVCHLVSSVYLRQDELALGKYSLNLSGVSKNLQDQQYTSRLYQLLSRLVTQSHLLSMTISTMNNSNLIPKKDYQANRLVSGLLQLSDKVHLVVDETCLSAGQLDTRGVSNLTALGNLINWQKINYDFQYHTIEQQTNVPVLIVSEGRAMVACDAEARLEPQHTDVEAAFSRVEAQLTPELLHTFRCYLTSAHLMDHNLPDDMQQMVQEDFVESRKNDGSITAADLHNLLVLARLVAVSCGESSLTEDIWKSTKILENERKLRLKK